MNSETPQLTKFKGHHDVDTLESICKEKGWPYHREKYDKEGDDNVSFVFETQDGINGLCVLNTCTGRFVVLISQDVFDSDMPLEGAPWFDELLATVYIPL